MRKNSAEIIDTVARVMAVSFEEDPMTSAQLEGLKKREQLLQAHSLMHALHALRSNMLHILDGDPRAFLIGQDTGKERKERQKLLQAKLSEYAYACIDLRNYGC